MTTLVIRWDSSDRSAIGQAKSTCTRSKRRKKSPSEVRLNAHRAQTSYENAREGKTKHRVWQRNTEKDQLVNHLVVTLGQIGNIDLDLRQGSHLLNACDKGRAEWLLMNIVQNIRQIN